MQIRRTAISIQVNTHNVLHRSHDKGMAFPASGQYHLRKEVLIMSKQELSNSEIARAAEIAQFRFALIAPVIQDLYPDKSRTQY